jgi:DNA topoisomerase-1
VLTACKADADKCGVQDVLKAVAGQLGNTPAVCRKSYVHPDVLALTEHLGKEDARAMLAAERWATAPSHRAGLTAGEQRLVALLRHTRSPSQRKKARRAVLSPT